MAILENVIVAGVVGLCVAYLLRGLYRTYSGNCSGCHGDCEKPPVSARQ